jgi:hypothetical protein
MGFFRRIVDSNMANSGTLSKPFLYVKDQIECRKIGPLVWYHHYMKKEMSSIGDDIKPYYVKTYELDIIRIFGILIRDREQNWKYTNL